MVLDERAGRAVATEHGIAHTGTVGLILQAKKRGLVKIEWPVRRSCIADGSERIAIVRCQGGRYLSNGGWRRARVVLILGDI